VSVADILEQMGQNAARRQLVRGQVMGNAVGALANAPGAILQMRDDQRVQDAQIARQQQQDARAEDSYQRRVAGDDREIAESAEVQRQKTIAHEIITAYTAGSPNDPSTNNLDAGIAKAKELGAPEFIEGLKAKHAAELQALQPPAPKVTQLNPALDTYTNGVLTTPAVHPEKVKTPAALGSFEDYVTRGATALGKPVDSLTAVDIEGFRKKYQQADDRPRVTVQTGAGAPGGLEPDAVELAATQYRILGTAGIPTRIDAGERVKIMNAAARQAKALGQSPAQAVQKQAAYKSDGASLTKMTTMAAAAEAFETKAIAQADLVRELSKKVKRTEWPIVNSALLNLKAATGDTDAHLFANGLLTFTTEYAKLMEGSTGSAAGSSEGARKDAAKLIATALNKGTIEKTLDQMQWEMRQTRAGYDTTIAHITDRMGGAPHAADPPPAKRIVYGMDGKPIS